MVVWDITDSRTGAELSGLECGVHTVYWVEACVLVAAYTADVDGVDVDSISDADEQ